MIASRSVQEQDRAEIKRLRASSRSAGKRWIHTGSNIEVLASRLPMPFIDPSMNLYLQLLLLAVSGWINRHQQSVIEYLQAENRALRQQLGPKRISGTRGLAYESTGFRCCSP